MQMYRDLLMCGFIVASTAIAVHATESSDIDWPAIERRAVPVGPDQRRLIESDWVDQDDAFRQRSGDAPAAAVDGDGAVTTQLDAAGGCDGIRSGRFGFHTASNDQDPWWQVDLGRPIRLDRIEIYNRTDGETAPRTRHLRILVAAGTEATAFVEVYRHNGETFYGAKQGKPLIVTFRDRDVTAQWVRLMVPGRCSFALDEVEIYAADDPQENVALHRPADQKSLSPYSCAGTRGYPYAPPSDSKPEASSLPAFSLTHAREIIRRAEALACRIEFLGGSDRLSPLQTELGQLGLQLRALESSGDAPEAARRGLYLAARLLLRGIAFCNPRLDFDKVLFVKRHDPGGLYHMVHQYYGFGARPGGGLFILFHPFSDAPKLVDVLEDSVVQHGRLAGQRLDPGSFLSPELSFDGRSILFAHSQCRGEGIEWSPRASFHLFGVRADGSDLVQLSDGPWNEFDPCFLPDGRIVFVSERRGGYLRCGGSAPPYDSPTYTLHSMAADGSDLRCLSFHETQEWQPSVDHNGMLAYTRWDYVDRDTNVAHHIWSCYPDGRNPRSYHGNYPTRRESRPWMEMSIRAVPDSHRYVATAAAHHGLAFGSLVLIDYRPLDDGAMSQVQRLTPDVPLPESEGGKKKIRELMAYGTAWPLSEDDYLCVYDRHAKNRGVYWIDRSGNRELLYRDPEITCLSPLPLRPRPVPPAVPDMTSASTTAGGAGGESEATGTVIVANVYDSDFVWPDDTKISALRIIQVLPKSTPPVDQPRIGVATETNARAVLGSVPVEEDGSAYFEAPAGKLLYFQALDQCGTAVQSMRSGTYLHAGECLTCQGCHEPKHRPPDIGRGPPLALLRPPSVLQPEAEGSNPFSYVRLVQPVLDRHCVDCHRERDALDLSGAPGSEYGWTRSYESLAGRYGFWFTVSNGSINSGIHGGSRTIAGKFGARAAPLLEFLDQRHYGVRLPAQDLRRITLWLDCNSEFYGAYHNTDAQSRGELVHPQLD